MISQCRDLGVPVLLCSRGFTPDDRVIVLAIGEETVATAVVVVDPEGAEGPPRSRCWCPFGFGH